MIKVLIADDHPIVRNGIKNVIEKSDDIEVKGEAENSKQVYDLIAKEKWDVIILDLKMPGVGGLEILKELKFSHPTLPIIVLSSFSEDLYGVASIKAGASAFLNKSTAPLELVNAIKKVAQGKKYINTSLAEKLADHLDNTSEKPPHFSLSPREFEVMKYLGSGLKVTDISNKLSLSISSVNSYRSRVLEKMHFKSNADIIQYFITHKLFE